MSLRLDRSFWTPLLILLSLGIATWRMLVQTAGSVPVDSTHETAAFSGGVLGGVLFPWIFAIAVTYGHWVWNKSRRNRDYMMKVYPYRRRVVLHATVLIVLGLMAAETLWRLLQSAG